MFLSEGSKVQHICYKRRVWSNKNTFVSTKTAGYYFLSLLYVFAVSGQSPSSDRHNGEKRSAVGFLQRLSPLTEPEYMKAFSAVKILESIHHGIFEKPAYAVLVGLN